MTSIRILVIEDEELAFKSLQRMLKNSLHQIEIIGWVKSVKSAKQWLKDNSQPDLIMLDIQIGDGISFSIFEDNLVDCPVIFTTAFQEYAIKAFELNSIDYLLKPFSQMQLDGAIGKYLKRSNVQGINSHMLQQILAQIGKENHKFKDRFHVKKGSKLYLIQSKDIAWIEKDTYVSLCTFKGEKFFLDYSLETLISQLDPNIFYRLNRQIIANIGAIEGIETHFNYKLKVSLRPAISKSVYVAKNGAKRFKEWLG